jgi:hypothetical protein
MVPTSDYTILENNISMLYFLVKFSGKNRLWLHCWYPCCLWTHEGRFEFFFVSQKGLWFHFCLHVDDVCAVLGCYRAWSAILYRRFGITYRSHFQGSSIIIIIIIIIIIHYYSTRLVVYCSSSVWCSVTQSWGGTLPIPSVLWTWYSRAQLLWRVNIVEVIIRYTTVTALVSLSIYAAVLMYSLI